VILRAEHLEFRPAGEGDEPSSAAEPDSEAIA
jgi:hypothetical protein